MEKKNIVCLCNNTITFEFEREINLDERPQYLEDILNGKFLSIDCPSCFKKHKPEYRIDIVWKSKNLKLAVIPELDRNMFYIKKKENPPFETVIGFPEMTNRLAVINDGLEPVVIETLKTFLLAKAMGNNSGDNINAWYYRKNEESIEFHIDGIRSNEVAVAKVPMDVYKKTFEDFRKKPKKPLFESLRVRKYLSVQNIYRPDVLK
ncbi:MAG: CpXC domain-containing protein [Treponema sp.]|nr:CpXC domain-containing protein [Treponema sp.]